MESVARTLPAILLDCAEAGLAAVEMDPTPENLKLLAACGLQTSGSYLGLPLHEPWENLNANEKVTPVAQRLSENGVRNLIVNADPKGGWAVKAPKTPMEIRRQGENLARLAELVQLLGVTLCFHNHADNRSMALDDLRSVTEFSSPQVSLCVDTGWAHTSSFDPITWIKDYPGRIRTLHLRNQRGPVPTEDLLEGDIDFEKLIAALKEIGYKGWLTLELWHPLQTHPVRSMIEDVRRSIEYLRGFLH